MSSSLKKPTGHLKAHPWITFQNKAIVQTIRLDDFPQLKGSYIDFMWVDVQGAEDIVFSGAKETLNRTHYIFTEYSNEELYAGQLNCENIVRLLGPAWNIVFGFGGDILLENINWNPHK